jgi:hypothetical protein
MVFCYRTAKADQGFSWEVYSVEYQSACVSRRTGVEKSRQAATARGKYWAEFLTQAHENFALHYNLKTAEAASA